MISKLLKSKKKKEKQSFKMSASNIFCWRAPFCYWNIESCFILFLFFSHVFPKYISNQNLHLERSLRLVLSVWDRPYRDFACKNYNHAIIHHPYFIFSNFTLLGFNEVTVHPIQSRLYMWISKFAFEFNYRYFESSSGAVFFIF